MFDEDRDRAAEVDAELDALEAEGAIVYGTASVPRVHPPGSAWAAVLPMRSDDVDASSPASISHTSPATVGAAPTGEEAKRTRPWWETDPVLGRRMGFLDEE